MKKTSAFIVTLFLSLSLFAQRQINDANAQVRDVKNFHAIRVSTGIELTLTQSTSEAVAVSASDVEDRDKIKTVVENGVLKIYFDNDSWKFWRDRGSKRLRAYVSVIKIDDLHISAGASTKVEGELKSDKLGLDVSSGAQFDGKVEVGSLNVDQSSGAQINISGKASSLNMDGSSGSVFKGYELVVENAEVDTSSGSVAELTINKELSAEASSGASVRYKGSGVIRNIRTGSAGAKEESSDRDKDGIIDVIDDTKDIMVLLKKKNISAPAPVYVEAPDGQHDWNWWSKVFPEFMVWAFGKN